MDLNERIAARREELALQQRQAKADAAVATQKVREASQQQRVEALDQIAGEITTAGITAKREGERLELVPPELPALDIAELKQSAVNRLVKREARRLWTPLNQWVVISLIAVGVAYLPAAGLGLAPLIIGVFVRASINEKYRAQVRTRLSSTEPPRPTD